MELIWRGLHEAITRNHQCAELMELLEYAEHSLEEKEPFSLQLGKDYRELELELGLETEMPKEVSVHLSCAPI